ncbi:hypothetical protein PHMEG_0001461 [Phytophthora megakarya]|uniref:Uncharacterized protein n=1 Tax=Phytophthora megakarya TaxID=4795 RepID=A0A225X321_9STRA|nr:hypothetical protein PHMEG_0001461 [Phytophthora megakarya]
MAKEKTIVQEELQLTSGAHWGSNEERIAARTNLLSMPLAFGQSAYFIPYCQLAGVIPHDVLDLMETDVEEHLEYTRAKLGMKSLPIMDRQSRNRLQETYTDT